MCRDREHGDRRCPSDTSEARRLRRKAQALRSVKKAPQAKQGKPVKPLSGNSSMEALKAHAEELKAKAYASPPEGMTQKEYDAEVEVQITAFGGMLAAKADKIAKFDKDEIDQKLDDFATKIYAPTNALLEEERKNARPISAAWRELEEAGVRGTEKFGLSRYLGKGLEEEREALPEEVKKVISDWEEHQNKIDVLMTKLKAIDKTYDAYKEGLYRESNEKLATAYQTVLAGIRPLGGEAKFNSGEDAYAAEVMASTVSQHYPAEWLKHHNDNDGEEVVLIATSGRASYNTSLFSETEDDAIEKHEDFNLKLTLPSKQSFILNSTFGKPTTVATFSNFAGEEISHLIYQRPEEEIYNKDLHGPRKKNGQPEGEGWVLRPTLKSVELKEMEKAETEHQILTVMSKKRWVRPVTTTKKRIKQLSIFNEEGAAEYGSQLRETSSYGKAVAYHEFGHRMEDVLPDNILPRQQRAFLNRRVPAAGSDKPYKNMVSINNTEELAWDGGFVTKYVGRSYFNEEHYEVFTTGVEALYGGNMGGLVGNSSSYYQKDSDHRAFTLGVMATL